MLEVTRPVPPRFDEPIGNPKNDVRKLPRRIRQAAQQIVVW